METKILYLIHFLHLIQQQSDIEPKSFYGKPQSYIEPHSCVELAGTLEECQCLRASKQSWVVVCHNLGTSSRRETEFGKALKEPSDMADVVKHRNKFAFSS